MRPGYDKALDLVTPRTETRMVTPTRPYTWSRRQGLRPENAKALDLVTLTRPYICVVTSTEALDLVTP